MVLHYLPYLVTAILSIAPSTNGACNFPESWRNPERWFRTWDSQGIADYWLIDFRASKYWWRPVFDGQGYDLDVDFVCYNEMGNDTYMFYTLEQPTFSTKFCAFSAESTNSLANKYKTVTGDNINSGADIDVTTCSSEVDGEPLTVYPKFPFSDFGSPSCPFSSGEYQVEYTSEGGVAQCAGDEDSIASVYDGVIRLSTCYNGMDSYENPLNENLTCVDTYPESLMGDGGGDMLLLADQSDPDRPKFYCARYNEVALTLTLSLNTENEYQTYCKPNVNSETDDTGYVAFRMTRTFDYTMLNETCNFPSAWTSPDRWWIGSAEITTFSVPVFNDYTQEQIDTSLVLNGNTLTTFATECYAQLQDETNSHIFLYNDTDEYFCNQEILYNNLIFHREISSANFFTVLSCDSDLQSLTTYRVYLQAPLATTFTGVTLPLTEGEYQATYSESYAMSDQCAGDQTSTATVSGQTIALNLCDSSNSYERPYQMTFTALATWSATELGVDSADGDFILLADSLPTDDGNFDLWCARYQVDGDTIYLSLTVTSTTSVECNTANDATYFTNAGDQKIRAFVLSVPGMTTTEAAMTTTGDMTTAEVTTQPPPTCDFQSAWTDADHWWIGTAWISGIAVPFYNTYSNTVYATQLIASGTTLSSFDTSCTSFSVESPDTCYYTFEGSSGHTCIKESVYNDNIIIRKDTVRATPAYVASDCAEALASVTLYRLLLRSPLADYFGGVTSPFTAGTYQVTYSESSSTENRCAGDSSSIAVFDANTIALDTCSGTNTYEQPYQTTFQIVAAWNATELEGDSADGDYLLLSSNTLSDGAQAYVYCARYKIIDEVLYMSIAVMSELKFECDVSRDYSYYSNGESSRHRAFIFTPEPVVTAPTTDVTTVETTPEVTTDYTTAFTTAVTTEFTTEFTTGVTTDVTTELTTDITTDVTTELTTDVTTEFTTGVTTDVTTELTTEITTEPTTDVSTELTTDITTGATTEFTTRVTTDATTDITTDATTDITTDITTDATTEITTDVTTDVTTDITTDVSTDMTTDVTTAKTTDGSTVISTDVTTEITTDVTTYVTTEVTTDATTEFTTDATTGYTSDVTTVVDMTSLGSTIEIGTTRVVEPGRVTTIEPSTVQGTTLVVTTQNMTPSRAIGVMSTTAEPSTAAPSTAQPSTAVPSTAQPSTEAPSTAQPTTASVTTTASQMTTTVTDLTTADDDVTTTVVDTTTPGIDLTTVMLDITIGNCSFPALWQAASQWWIGTAELLSTAVPYYKNYESNEISTDLVSGGTVYHALDTACILMGEEDPNTVYYTTSSDSTQLCVQEIIPSSTPEIIFRREILREATAYTLNECRTLILAEGIFNLYLQAPLASVFPGQASPFTEGIYQATYSASSSSMNNCAADATSTAVITGSTITLQTCTSTNTYSEPYQSTLYVIASWTADVLGVDSADGDFLLLTNALPTAEEMFDVYCARYKVVDSVVSFSLYVHSNVGAHCDVLRDYMYYSDNVDDEFRAFQLTFMAEIPSTTQAPTTTGSADVTTQASVDATTQTQQDVTSQSQQEVTTQASVEVTTSMDAMTTAAANDSAQHVTIVAEGDYYTVVSPDEQAFIDAVTPQIATEAGVDQNQIINVEATAGSIILDFDIIPGDSSQPGYIPVSSAVSMIGMAVDMGRLNFTLPDGTVIPAQAGSMETFISPPDGPCASGPCLNGATCVDRTISLPTCECADGYSGSTCQVQGQASSSGDDDDYQPIVIGICAIAGIIVVLTILSIVVCYWRRREQKEEPEYHAEEGQFGFAKSWTAGYMQFGSSAYGDRQNAVSVHQQDQGHTNNIYATMLSNGSSYPSASYGYR